MEFNSHTAENFEEKFAPKWKLNPEKWAECSEEHVDMECVKDLYQKLCVEAGIDLNEP